MVKPGHLLLHHLLLSLSSLHSPSNSSPSFLSPLVLDGGQFCNGIDIPFPFGISGYTSLAPGFNITCNRTQGNRDLQTSPPRLKLLSDELLIIDISLNDGFLRVNLDPLNWRCDSPFAEEPSKYRELLKDSPFTFSSTQNVFTVIGCDAMVFLQQQEKNKTVKISCVSFCESTESVVDGLCSGVGCCQASLPEKLKSFDLDFQSIRNMTGSNVTNMLCGRAFILEQKAFEFSAEDINGGAEGGAPRSVVLNWSIGNKSCEEAKRSGGDSYICAERSKCYDSSTGVGYLCRCLEGYDGNPYIPDGCKEVDKCSVNGTNPCKWKCLNFDGGYIST